jgi:RHS repeat-associated protein
VQVGTRIKRVSARKESPAQRPTWTPEHLPATITTSSGTESYTYDADGERVVRVAGGVTTASFEGLWEQTTAGAWKTYYRFNGQVVALRDSATNAVTYLHGDHLGSVSVTTNASGTANVQEYDPWGSVRSGSITQTSLNYTGQRLDGTGLLDYHARMYDPVLARFVSADSVVPGSASGSMDGVQLRPLTVDFHEPGFVGTLNTESAQPFWFQLSDDAKQQVGEPWGPQEAQALNRYSYVQNGPVTYSDPTGHAYTCTAHACGIPASGGNVRGGGISGGGAAVVAGAGAVGGYALAQDESTQYDASHRDKGGGYEKRRTTDGRTVRVRRLGDKEVRERGLHDEKQGQGYHGKPAIYEDDDGNLYVGGRGGGLLEPEF